MSKGIPGNNFNYFKIKGENEKINLYLAHVSI